MKIEDQALQLMIPPEPYSAEKVYKMLETIGRVCYKSEDRITDTSYETFLKKLNDAGHWAMLEHYIIIVRLSEELYNSLMSEMVINISNDPSFSNFITFVKFSVVRKEDINSDKDVYICSASPTAISNLFATKSVANNKLSAFYHLCHHLWSLFSLIIRRPDGGTDQPKAGFGDSSFEFPGMKHYGFKMLSQPQFAELLRPGMDKDYVLDTYALHASMTVMFKTNRAICMEILRHRPASYAMTSTRYCLYSKDKFGNEITVIKPEFCDDLDQYHPFVLGCQETETAYLDMVRKGSPAQNARDVLPNALMAELVMTTRLMEWKHFFRMRCAKGAHPMIRVLANTLRDTLIDVEGLLISPYGNKLFDLGGDK